MKAFGTKLRLIALMAVICLAGIGSPAARAQSAAVSPSNLSFGAPTGSTTSAPDTVTFSVTPGEGSFTATVTSITITGTNAGEFSETDNCVGAPFSAPGACTISVTFKPSPSLAAGLLQTATLNIFSNANEGPSTVSLSGAVGAIKLFDALNINHSLPNTPDFPGRAVKTTTVTLACPTTGPPPQGTLSSSPDGLGDVFQDNYIRATILNSETSPRNVCTGGATDANLNGGANGTNCFQLSYEGVAGSFLGQDPDTASAGSFLATYGVAPLNVTSLLAPGSQSLTFELVDIGLPSNPSGAFLGAGTLHLVTNCTLVGVQTNGTITSDPIDPGNPASLTPQFTFNSTPNQHIDFDANYLKGLDPNNEVTFPDGTVAQVTDRGIAQADFPGLVAGTSAGPAICLRYAGEKAADGVTQLCKAFTIECTNNANSTPAGVNCPNSVVRSLLYETRFDSPDFLPNTNPITPETGPGFLMGPDVWNTVADCTFTAGPETGQLCPQNPLTVFKGAADPSPGGTPRGVNSTFIPVLNMPLPSTKVTVTTDSFFEWQNTTTVTVKFAASPADYSPTAQRPANGFIAAPIQSVTFGTSPANAPLPDTTFPIATDTTLFNGGGSTSACPGAPAGRFNTSATFTRPEGRYRLHYFATDCANTEELRFRASNNPNTNWATFKEEELNIDTSLPVIPVLTLSTTTPAAGQKVTATFECKDPTLADGNPGSGVVFCGPFFFFAVADTGLLHNKFTATGHGPKTYSVTAVDLAGNVFTVSTPYTVH